MNKPIIGITPQYDYERNRVWINPCYTDAITAGGGIPLLLPLHIEKEDLRTAAANCQGFLFTGGPDISPFLYGEETLRQCGVVVPERDRMEMDLLSVIIDLDKPIFGICRGIQTLNVYLGGTLYQDIPAQITAGPSLAHFQASENHILSHRVQVERGSLLSSILLKESLPVNSFHHQSIKDPAPSLKVAGTASDSVIEAVYLPEKRFFLGVQWHPEFLYSNNEDAFRLFEAFVKASISNS